MLDTENTYVDFVAGQLDNYVSTKLEDDREIDVTDISLDYLLELGFGPDRVTDAATLDRIESLMRVIVASVLEFQDKRDAAAQSAATVAPVAM